MGLFFLPVFLSQPSETRSPPAAIQLNFIFFTITFTPPEECVGGSEDELSTAATAMFAGSTLLFSEKITFLVRRAKTIPSHSDSLNTISEPILKTAQDVIDMTGYHSYYPMLTWVVLGRPVAV